MDIVSADYLTVDDEADGGFIECGCDERHGRRVPLLGYLEARAHARVAVGFPGTPAGTIVNRFFSELYIDS